MTAIMSTQELGELRDRPSDLRILDVRSGAEFETAHIPGSYHVPLETLREHRDEFAKLDDPIVLVCQSGVRATEAQTSLQGAGKQELKVLEGGIAKWESEGGDVIRGEQRWALERQVRLVAGSLVLTGIVGSLFAPKMKYLAGAIGAGLTFSALSNTCAMGNLLSRLPYNQTLTCDVDAVLTQLDEGIAPAA